MLSAQGLTDPLQDLQFQYPLFRIELLSIVAGQSHFPNGFVSISALSDRIAQRRLLTVPVRACGVSISALSDRIAQQVAATLKNIEDHVSISALSDRIAQRRW